MHPFNSAWLANIAAALTANPVSGAGRRIRKAVDGTDAETALKRAVHTAVVAVVQQAGADTADESDLPGEIPERFFKDPDTARELLEILNGLNPDREQLKEIFEESGYDPETLPGIRFDEAVTCFEAAFLAAASQEEALQPVISIGHIIEQTRIQRELPETMKNPSVFLKESRAETVGIEAGIIKTENAVNGQQYQFILKGEGAEPEIREVKIENSQVGVAGDHATVQGDIRYGDDIGIDGKGDAVFAKKHGVAVILKQLNLTVEKESDVRKTLQRYLTEPAAETDRLPRGRLSPGEACPGQGAMLRFSDVYSAPDTAGPEKTE